MLKILSKIIPTLTFWGIFALAITTVNYPDSLAGATLVQIGIFFIPLFLALISTINLFFKSLLKSAVLVLGIILSLILKSLGNLNIVTAILVIVAVVLISGSFKKGTSSSLTYRSKIPKLKNLLRKKT